MKHTTGKLICGDGIELYYQEWNPVTKPRAIIVILHGIGGHSGQSTYTHLITNLVEFGYAFFGIDLRGHGRSSGRRGSINKWADYRDDLRMFLLEIKQTHSIQPIFLLGQSLGGLIAVEYALHYPNEIQGVIASAPALSVPNISPVLIFFLKMISPLWPHLALSPKFDVSGVSRDPKEVKKLLDDPFTDPKMSPRLAVEYLSTLQWTQAHAADFQVPLLLILGSADPITSPEGSKTFFNHVNFEDKTLKIYEGGFHQPFIDINRQQVFMDLTQWLDQHE